MRKPRELEMFCNLICLVIAWGFKYLKTLWTGTHKICVV